MDGTKYLSEKLFPGERKFIRDSLIRSLVVAFGIAGAAKRLRKICFLTHTRGDAALMAYLQAAKNVQKLCVEVCPFAGNRYTRARTHVRNRKVLLTPYAIVKQLYALGGFYLRKAYGLNKEITNRAISRVEGFSQYRRFLIGRGLFYQH